MTSGLFTKNNLSEQGLDATDALQKLYLSGIKEDMLLFAYSKSLESSISSPGNDLVNQIYGFINQSITDSKGEIFQRTKILTQGVPGEGSSRQNILTYSDGNLVWFESFPSSLDRRIEPGGAPIKVSDGNSLVSVSIQGVGKNYSIIDSWGNTVSFSGSIEINAVVQGLNSKSRNAKIRITLNEDGSLDLDKGVSIIDPGSGYVPGEYLEIVSGCFASDQELEDNCLFYSESIFRAATGTRQGTLLTVSLNNHGLKDKSRVSLEYIGESEGNNGQYTISLIDENSFTVEVLDEGDTSNISLNVYQGGCSLVQDYFKSEEVSYKASFKSERYYYRVVSARAEGFFLYDDKVQEYFYLGPEYNSLLELDQRSDRPIITLKRDDSYTSENLSKLYKLNGRSAFWSYDRVFETKESISSNTRSLSDQVESIRSDLSLFVQNTKLPALRSDPKNILGIQCNIFEGLNITSNHRIVFRDPDNVLDQTQVGFLNLSVLNSSTVLNNQRVPGIWLWTGEKYQRAFSSDDKPFVSINGTQYLSPALYNIDGNELDENIETDYKYSVSTGYFRQTFPETIPATTDLIKGFNMQVSVLIQNISSNSSNGGFYYHRTLTPTTIRTVSGVNGYVVKSWPLFSYREGGQIKNSGLLAI